MYYDGHERPDVVAYRQSLFIPSMLKLESFCEHYEGDEMEITIPRANAVDIEKVPFVHDECCFHANDGTGNNLLLL